MIKQLSLDELKNHAKQLWIRMPPDAGRAALEGRIRERLQELGGLDRGALEDICAWSGQPVQADASPKDVVLQAAAAGGMKFEGLSDRGLRALCQLRMVQVSPLADRRTTIRALKWAEPWSHYLRRKRRRWMGSLLSRFVYEATPQVPAGGTAVSQGQRASLKHRIEQEGVVGGLSRTIRGVADDYVREKLDEIEQRIDRKLEQIDLRLEQWRDREIRNRLRIVKITLLASIIVALLSLGYDYIKKRAISEPESPVSRRIER